MTDRVNMETLVKSYTRQIRDTEKHLTDLERRSKDVRGRVEQRHAARDRIEALQRQRAALEGEREDLKGLYAEASFENDTAELQRISKRKVAIDGELQELERGIRESRSSIDGELDSTIAELILDKQVVEQRLPKQFYNSTANQHPIVEAVEQALKDDARRLRKRFNAIDVPAASKHAVDSVRRSRGYVEQSDPAWLVRQEEKRREKMQRFTNVAGNTDAVAAASGRMREMQTA